MCIHPAICAQIDNGSCWIFPPNLLSPFGGPLHRQSEVPLHHVGSAGGTAQGGCESGNGEAVHSLPAPTPRLYRKCPPLLFLPSLSRLFSTAPYLFLRGWLWQTLVFRRKVALLSLKNKASLGALGCFRPQRAPTSFHISWIWGSQAAQCDGGFAVHLGCAPVYGSLAYLSVPLCFLGFSPLKLCFFSLLPSPQGNSILCFQQLSVS